MENSDFDQTMGLVENLYRIFGIYTRKKAKNVCFQVAFLMYCLLVFLLQLCGATHKIIWYEENGSFTPLFIRKLVVTTISVAAPITNLLLIRGSCYIGKFKTEMGPLFENSENDRSELGFILKRKMFTAGRIGFVFASIPTFYMLMDIIFRTSTGILFDSKQFETYFYPIPFNSSYVVPFGIVITMAQLYCVGMWQVLATILTIITFILCQRFYMQGIRLKRLCKQTRSQERELIGTFDIENERLHFERLLSALDSADNMLSAPISFVLGLTVAATCLLIYNLVYDDTGITSRVFDLQITTFNVLLCTVILVDCGLLSWAVRSFFNIFFTIF